MIVLAHKTHAGLHIVVKVMIIITVCFDICVCANLLLIMLVQYFDICLLAAGRQLQRQTDEWRHTLEQRETELTTSQTSLQVCYVRVIAFR